MWKLLEELAEIDAKTYEKISFACMDAFEGHTPESMLDDSPNDEVEIVCDLIQGACQRVIAARGWHWLLEDSDPSIRTNVGGFVCDICDKNYDVLAGYIQGDTPAKAILAAYLAARKVRP